MLYNQDWHLGVIGIVAQKVMEKFGKPSIILTKVGDYLKVGKGRQWDRSLPYGSISIAVSSEIWWP